ncbi:PAS domain-containing protein [Hufsiella ginkgonis]|uniref:histidine kinase n=1 Tax=Hufsiella ginkgonis TaxID=2695274 RepID=A0A7K1XXR8_9SPHI|nr:PAS domain-containing protein [Hufsiella ginkgonis]MXV15742.1 PAS domain-containing protein [Hufsiella ginkgonis]
MNGETGLSPEMMKVFETLPGLYLVLSPDLIMLTASDAYLRITAKKREDVAGRHIFEVFTPGARDQGGRDVANSLIRVINTREPHEIPVARFDFPDPADPAVTRSSYWRTSHTPVLNSRGEIRYIIHFTEDVTAQEVARQQLTASLEEQTRSAAKALQMSNRMEKLVREIPARIAILSGPDWVFEYTNPHFEAFFSQRSLRGKPLLEAMPELAGHEVLKALKHVYDTGETYSGTEMRIPMVRQDGGKPEDHYFNFVYQARYDENGVINGILSFAYNITELVTARELLQESGEEIQATNEELKATNEDLYQAQRNLQKLNEDLEKRVGLRTSQLLAAREDAIRERDRLNAFFMQAPAGICVLDGPEMIFELVNPPYQQLFPGRNLRGKPLLEALPEFAGHPICDILIDIYRTGKTFEGKEVMVPLASNDDGPVEERYFNFIYQAKHDIHGMVDGILVFVFEVTETVLTRRKKEENEKRFRFLLNAIPQQVWTSRPDGALDYVNQVVCDDFGQPMEVIVGSGWNEFIHPDDLGDCLRKWRHALEAGTAYTVEFRLRFKDGDYRWHLGRALPLIENGQIAFWLGTNTNIDIQKDNEQRKDEFLSIASHELKTPLTSIKAFNQMMQRTDDAERLAGFAKKSAGHIFRLEKLISDLLDVTKINAGKMIYNMQPFSLKQMLADTIESVQHMAPSHQLILEHAEDVEYTGDRFRLEQVVSNFLNNAIKYSPGEKEVIINCEVERDNVVVSVKDFGIGIAEGDLLHLFERYYRVDNTAMRFEGLGLGLFISSEILKRHQGSFWIESQPGAGSTFYFRLPLDSHNVAKAKRIGNTFYQDTTITITYYERSHRIYADWTGFQDLDSVKNGCLVLLEMAEKNRCSKIVNDNTHVLGSWSEAVDWVSGVFFPMLEKAGITHLAWVYAPNVFSRLSANKAAGVAAGNIDTQLFTALSEAEKWIDNR